MDKGTAGRVILESDSSSAASNMTDDLVAVTNVSKRFCRNLRKAARYGLQDILKTFIPSRDVHAVVLRPDEFWALKNVHFAVKKGEVVGVIGPNGSGKSTLLNVVSGVLKPTTGSVVAHSRKIVLLDYSLGLNPLMTGRENIHNKLSLMHDLGTFNPRDVEEIADFSGLGSLVDVAVGTYSTGMRARLAFSIYTKINPDLFIVDEGLGTADIQFINKIHEYWVNYVKQGGSMLFASHDISTVQLLCDRVVVLDGGEVVFSGGVDEGIHWYYDHENVAKPEVGAARTLDSIPGVKEELTQDDVVLGEVCDLSQTNEEAFPVKIDAIEIVSLDGQDPQRVETTGTVRANLHYSSSGAYENVWWGLDFHDDQGRFVTHILSRGAVRAPIHIKPGKGVLSCRIDNLPLMPGQYQVRGGILRDEAVLYLGWKGYKDAPHVFRVYGVPGNAMQSARSRRAQLFMSVEWGV